MYESGIDRQQLAYQEYEAARLEHLRQLSGEMAGDLGQVAVGAVSMGIFTETGTPPQEVEPTLESELSRQQLEMLGAQPVAQVVELQKAQQPVYEQEKLANGYALAA